MKKKYLICFFILFCLSRTLSSQNLYWQWARSANSYTASYCSAMTADNAGNSYVTGGFYGAQFTLGTYTLSSFSAPDIYIAKYDPSGNVEWAVAAGGAKLDFVYAISVDIAGNVLVSGTFQSDAFTVGNVTLLKSGAGTNGFNVFVIKIDASGNLLWAINHPGFASGEAITSDSNGNIYVAGYYYNSSLAVGAYTLFNSGSGTDDGFVAKYNASGTVQWARKMGGPMGDNNSDHCSGITCDNNDNVIVCGDFDSFSLPIGTLTLTNNSQGPDAYVAKLDGAGNPIWAKSMAGTNSEYAHDVSTNNNGDVFLSGSFSSPQLAAETVTLTHTSASSTDQDIFVMKLNSAGAMQWANREGTTFADYIYDLCADSDGGCYICGNFAGLSMTFGALTLTNSVPSGNSIEAFLVKYNISGAVTSAIRFGGSGSEEIDGIGQDAAGNIYIAGTYDSEPLLFGSIALTGGPSRDFFVAKATTVAPNPVSVSASGDQDHALSIFPNPASTKVNITATSSLRAIVVNDMIGKILQVISVSEGSGNVEVDLDCFDDGVYLLTSEYADGHSRTNRLSIIR